MANDYYNDPEKKIPLTTIRSSARNNDAAAVAAGFDKLPSELNLKRSQYGVDNSISSALFQITVPNLDVTYYVGLEVTFQAMFGNSANANISVNGQTIVPIIDSRGEPVIANNIVKDQVVTLVYVETPITGYQLINTAVTAQNIQDAQTAAAEAAASAQAAFESASSVSAMKPVVFKFLIGAS